MIKELWSVDMDPQGIALRMGYLSPKVQETSGWMWLEVIASLVAHSRLKLSSSYIRSIAT
jgi:hypothetical protein